MDKYKRLVSNTFVFAIAAFSSKVLIFLMMPLYTRVMSTSDFGLVDVLVQTCNLLIPFATIGINNAIIRFGLERSTSKKGVFTIGLMTILLGFVIMVLCDPLISKVTVLEGYTQYLSLFVLASARHRLWSQFARAIGYVRFYAIDGVFSTILTIVLNILFLVVFRWGIAGYIWSTIITDFTCAVLVFLLTRLHRFLSFKKVTKALYYKMLAYCMPLIPNTVCSLIVSISGRYIITYMMGEAANGIYAVSNKIPTILMIVANIFAEAWQISAVTGEEGRDQFFSRVCSVYQALAFSVAAVLIVTAQLSTRILAAPEYYEAWQYIPFLVMATTFSCIATFLSSIYMVEKKSVCTLLTTVLGVVVNIVFNILWIPLFGIYGASFATLVSYFVMFAVRAVHTRKYVRIRWNIGRLVCKIIALSAECAIMISQCPFYLVYSIILTLFVLMLNFKDVIAVLRARFIKR